jgi:mannose-6-phosphate isomerase-like protein (cupin superfamily)
MDAAELEDVLATIAGGERPYHEVMRTHDLSVGVYVLDAGATDHQNPHTEDEVYYVVAGRATITVGAEERPVQAGSIVFVDADVPHRFHDITEQLVILVVFGPAEYTHRVDHDRGHPHGAGEAAG